MSVKGKARVLTLLEFKKVEKMITLTRYVKRNLAILYLSFGVGLRACEIRRLKIGDILNKDGTLKELVSLTKTKGNKQRDMYLTNKKVRAVMIDHIIEMKRLLSKKRIPFASNTPVFMSQKGGPFLKHHLVALICSFFKAAGIEGAKSHSGRRTFITTKIDEGYDLKAIADIVGHSNIQSTVAYHQSNPTRLKKISETSIF
jgi:integrase/recombinase XerD